MHCTGFIGDVGHGDWRFCQRDSAGLISGGADGVGNWKKGHSLVHWIVGAVAAAMDSCCSWNYARLMYLRSEVSCTLPAFRIGEGPLCCSSGRRSAVVMFTVTLIVCVGSDHMLVYKCPAYHSSISEAWCDHNEVASDFCRVPR